MWHDRHVTWKICIWFFFQFVCPLCSVVFARSASLCIVANELCNLSSVVGVILISQQIFDWACMRMSLHAPITVTICTNYSSAIEYGGFECRARMHCIVPKYNDFDEILDLTCQFRFWTNFMTRTQRSFAMHRLLGLWFVCAAWVVGRNSFGTKRPLLIIELNMNTVNVMRICIPVFLLMSRTEREFVWITHSFAHCITTWILIYRESSSFPQMRLISTIRHFGRVFFF